MLFSSEVANSAPSVQFAYAPRISTDMNDCRSFVTVQKAVAGTQGERGRLLARAARDAIVPLGVALVLDCILQQMINGRIRPLAAVIVGGLLVFLPFLIVRALTNRIWTHRHRGTQHA